MPGEKDNKVLEIIAIILIFLLLWRIFKKKAKITIEPTTTPQEFEDQGLVCQNIYYKPLAGWGPFPDNFKGGTGVIGVMAVILEGV